jgi:hypothetical protein
MKNCFKCKKEFSKPYNCSKKEWITTKYCSHSCANSINSLGNKRSLGKPSSRKGKKMLDKRGINHPNWKGGKGGERHMAMGQIEYILWRTAVLVRDNYTCQMCLKRGSQDIEVDHIKPWALYPELRYAIDNGRTLCVPCHRSTDTWGYKVFKAVVAES